jgi:arylsulfatase A-like enzyme
MKSTPSFFLSIALALSGLAASPAEAENKPNIVYVLVDNWGWGDISVQGSTIQTPRIDAFAAEGMRFTNFNVQNQCTPTRSALHTGRLPIRTGTQKVPAPGEPDGMALWEYTIAELLSDAGYKTALYGKWHVGSKPGSLPNDQGYDHFWGINEGSQAAAYTSTPAMIRWPGKIAPGTVTDEIIADLDMYPTIATLVGESERIPTDRPIDGISQAAFVLGDQEKSDREYVVTYVGDTVFAVKWRNMKVHFATFEGTHSVLHKYTFPQVFDISEDVKESYELWGNEGYAHAWVMGPVSKILTGLSVSMQEYPNIKPGDQDFKGYK